MMPAFLSGRRCQTQKFTAVSQLDPAAVRGDGASEVFALSSIGGSVADDFFLFQHVQNNSTKLSFIKELPCFDGEALAGFPTRMWEGQKTGSDVVL